MSYSRRLYFALFLFLFANLHCKSSAEQDNTDGSSGTQGDPVNTSDPDELDDKLSANCAPECFALNSTWCVKNAKKQCVECTQDKHCKENPFAKGSVCENNTCKCKSNDNCKNNIRGERCSSFGSCGCDNASDCVAGGICKSSKVCGCADSRSCVKKETPFCDTAKGDCVQCADSSNCKNPRNPICSQGKCTQCTPSTGQECSNNPLSFGPTCTAGGYCVCNATDPAACRNNKGGTKCDTGLCECRGDGECGSGKVCVSTVVRYPSGVEEFKPYVTTCQPRCTRDSDCKNSGSRTVCDTSSGVCGYCSPSNLQHCKAGESCNRGKCAECRAADNNPAKDHENPDCLKKTPSGYRKYCSDDGHCRPCLENRHCDAIDSSVIPRKVCSGLGPDTNGEFVLPVFLECRECGRDGDCELYPKNVTAEKHVCSFSKCIQCYPETDDCARFHNTAGRYCQEHPDSRENGGEYEAPTTQCGCRLDHPEDCSGLSGKTCKKLTQSVYYTCQ